MNKSNPLREKIKLILFKLIIQNNALSGELVTSEASLEQRKHQSEKLDIREAPRLSLLL